MSNPPSAIIFDLDNTLVDDEFAVSAGLLAFHKVYGETLGWQFETLLDHWRRLLELYYQRYAAGEISMQDQRRKRLIDLFKLAGFDLAPEEADARFDVYRHEYVRSWRVFPDVLAALGQLKGQRKVVLTNGSVEAQGEKLRASGLTGYFDGLYGSVELGAAKPSQEAFWGVCTAIGREPGACLHVGDNLELDARGAAQAGLRSVWLNRRGAAEQFDGQTISTLTELIHFVQ